MISQRGEKVVETVGVPRCFRRLPCTGLGQSGKPGKRTLCRGQTRANEKKAVQYGAGNAHRLCGDNLTAPSRAKRLAAQALPRDSRPEDDGIWVKSSKTLQVKPKGRQTLLLLPGKT